MHQYLFLLIPTIAIVTLILVAKHPCWLKKPKRGKRIIVDWDDGGDGFDENFGRPGLFDQAMIDYQNSLAPHEDYTDAGFQEFLANRIGNSLSQ